MKLLVVAVLLVGLVAVESASLKDKRAGIRRLLDEVRKRESDEAAASKRQFWVDWEDLLDTDGGINLNASWIQDWLNDFFTDSSEEDTQPLKRESDETGVSKRRIWVDWDNEIDTDEGIQINASWVLPAIGDWLTDLFTHSNEEDTQPLPEERKHHGARRANKRHHQKKVLPQAEGDNNLEMADEDFEEAFKGQTGSELPTFLEVIPALLGGNAQGAVEEWENTDGENAEPTLYNGDSEGDAEAELPSFEDWFNNIDWDAIVNSWVEALEDLFSGSGMPEGFLDQEKPTHHEGERPTTYQRPATRDYRGKLATRKQSLEEHWQDIDWAAVNNAIQQAFDKAKEHYKET